MKLKKIEIENYRAFENFVLDFNNSTNVIYGINGVGKTSILYIIFDIFQLLLNWNGIPSNFQIFSEDRYRDKKKIIKVKLTLIDDKNKEKFISLKRKFNELSIDNNKISNTNWRKNKELYDKTEIQTNIEEGDIKPSTLCAFLPGISTKEIIQATPTANGLQLKFERQPFVYSRGIKNYKEFKSNFENLESKEMQNALEKRNFDYQDDNLRKFRNAIRQFNPDFGEIKIDRDKKHHPLYVKKGEFHLDLSTQLSSGESTVITMFGQILLGNINESNIPSEPSIVIIDELENSLHPKWQNKIINILKSALPNTQFIITSHSPFTWSRLDRKEVILLSYEENKIIKKDIPYAIGGYHSSIIADYFDTEDLDEKITDKVKNIEYLIENNNLSKAKNEIENLKKDYGKIPLIDDLLFKIDLL